MVEPTSRFNQYMLLSGTGGKTGLKDFKLPIEPVGSTQAPPFFEKLSVMVGTMDTFLNNQSLGVKKNSFQFTSAITYTME